ncbi:MAG: hypothetical protein J6A59_13265, partial [Lachnospiraceae bacterium]|nr:hypothetical protein [Lachnospiraceae bacterium]
QCSCEKKTTKIIYKVSLTHGRTKSCGCKQGENLVNTLMNNYGENCSARINNPRELWQIETLSSRDKLCEYIRNLGYKPTTQQLSHLLNVNDTTLLQVIHKYMMDDYIIISSMISEDELELCNYVKSISRFEVNTNVRNIIQPYELDIYIPEKKLAIEFNGNYWHSTKQKDSSYHQNKTIACAKQGIQLIHIFEYEWKNNKDKIKKFIYDKLNETKKIYARDTTVEEVSNLECIDFLNKYHLQGYISSAISIALKLNGDIIAVMSFGSSRFDDYQYELFRYCVKSDISIIGGAEKLFKYFVDRYTPNSIVTYSDISKFTGNVYSRLNFKVINITKPGYVWVNTNTNKVLSRYQTQKRKLVDSGLGTDAESEDIIMNREGYLKVYNSGNIKMVWKK